MSIRLAASRLYLRTFTKPRLARMSVAEAKVANLPDPPEGIAARHACEVADLGGVRSVWLERDRASVHGAFVLVHGGSFISGPYRSHWDYLSRMVEATGMAGLLIDYRLAPDHPFPAAIEDCVAAIAAAAEARQLAPGQWVMAGDGSGGGLAVAVCSRLRDSAADPPAGLILVSPELDLALANPEIADRERGDPMMPAEAPRLWNAAYVGDHDWRDPLISPLFGDPAGLPPALAFAGSTEILVPDILAWCERCRRAGVEVTYMEQPGGFHDFALASPRLPEARRAQERQAAFIRACTEAAAAAAL
jgi:monoterpene epsilon-lactone hydrolase